MAKTLTCFVVGFLLSAVIWAGGSKEENTTSTTTLVIASDATWPPMEFLNEDKELVGLAIDILHEIERVSDFNIEIRNTAWDGIFAGLSNGNYDAVASSVTITEERRKSMDFTIPYVNAGQVIVTRNDQTGITTLDDIDGQEVGAQIGTTGAIEVAKYPKIKLKNYDEIGLAVEDLANGNLVAVVLDSPVAADYVLANKNYQTRLKIVGQPFTEEYFGIAVNKGNTKVLNLLNSGLQKIIESGKLAELQKKWLGK